MNNLEKIVKELIEYPREEEWFEFKENWYEPIGIGEYISSAKFPSKPKTLSQVPTQAPHPMQAFLSTFIFI